MNYGDSFSDKFVTSFTLMLNKNWSNIAYYEKGT